MACPEQSRLRRRISRQAPEAAADVTRLLLTMVFVVAATFTPISLGATVIVVVQTKDGYWVGADGTRGSLKSQTPKEQVCKIHESHGWVILKSGSSQSLDRYGSDYSVDAQVEKLVEESISITQLKDSLISLFSSEEDEVLRWYIAKLSPSTLSELDPLKHPHDQPLNSSFQNDQVRALTLIGYDTDHLVNLSLLAAPISQSNTGIPEFPYSLSIYSSGWVPTDFGSSPMNILSYPKSSHPPIKHSAEWITSHPLEEIREFLEAAHADDPGHAARPYAILHIMTDHKTSAKPNSFDGSRSKLKLKWIEKGACPGWTTDLLQDDAVAK